MNVVLAGLLGSLAAGLMTAVGALPILAGRTIPRQLNHILLGFAAGIMLSASFFSLIIPALEVSEPLYGGGLVPPALVSTGIAIGAIAIYALDKATQAELNSGRSYRAQVEDGIFSLSAKKVDDNVYYYVTKRVRGRLFKAYVAKSGEATASQIRDAIRTLLAEIVVSANGASK